jgi:alpha-tubulin suppressor-like RCC1 family protein
MALTQAGEVWAWGDNYYWELGDGTRISRAIPSKVGGLGNTLNIGAGAYSGFAVQSDGTVLGWGWNYGYELATTTSPIALPFTIPGISGVQYIIGGYPGANSYYTICQMTDQSIWGWGSNNNGVLASTTYWGAKPTQLSISGVSSVDSGDSFCLGLKSDGTILAWGLNDNGQLGNASVGGSTATPTAIPGLSTISAVFCGVNHAFALQTDGKLWAWGKNDAGQLGDGTIVNRTAPVSVWW